MHSVGQEMLTPSRTPDFTHVYTLLNLSVLGLCLRINDSSLFAWFSLDCFVSDLFYSINCHHCCHKCQVKCQRDVSIIKSFEKSFEKCCMLYSMDMYCNATYYLVQIYISDIYCIFFQILVVAFRISC